MRGLTLRNLSVVVVFCLLLVLFAVGFVGTAATDEGPPAEEEYAALLDGMAGDGSENSPYVITNVSELQAVAGDLSAFYELGDDINATATAEWNTGDGFNPISNTTADDGTPVFNETFDGNGFVISNLTIDRADQNYVGLFRNSTGTITDVELENVSVTGSQSSPDHATGALIGHNRGTVTKSYATGTVTGESAGGLIGDNDGASPDDAGLVSESSANVTVSGIEGVGGLVGVNAGNVTHSNATGDVDGTSYVGGLVGDDLGEVPRVEESYATGTVSGTTGVGGLIGRILEGGKVNKSYATGDVSGDERVGGLLGNTESGAESVPVEVSESYAAGAVSGTAEIGGLVGNNSHGDIVDSYWDSLASGVDSGVGVGGGDSGLTGLDTPQMLGDAAEEYMFEFGTTWDVERNTQVSYPFLQSNTQEPAPGSQEPLFAGGVGTAEEPWQVANWDHLDNVRDSPSSHFILIDDIDNEAERPANFEPIGDDALPFTGMFEGDGHLIQNLTIDRGTEDYVGLFGKANSTGLAISNLTLDSVDITGNSRVGGLGGRLADGDIHNVSVSGDVVGDSAGNRTGGLAGSLAGSTETIEVDTVSVTGTVQGGQLVGGIAGATDHTTNLTVAYSQTDVTAGDKFGGGIVGWTSQSPSNFSELYAAGEVTGVDSGGVVGVIGEPSETGNEDEFTESVYWDETLEPAPFGLDNSSGQATTDWVGLPTEDMQGDSAADEGNMDKLDFENTWKTVLGGYPIFQWQTPSVDTVEITGTVTDALDDAEIEGATVDSSIDSTTTDGAGEYSIQVAPDGDTVNATAEVDEGFTITNETTLDNPEEGDQVNLSLAPEYDGHGNATDPYQVADVEDLQQIRYNLTAHYELVSDINATETEDWFGGAGFEPIAECNGDFESRYNPCSGDSGMEWDPFTGNFEGNGHLIENLTINRPNKNAVGLFEAGNDAVFKNIRLENVDIRGYKQTSGFLAHLTGSDVMDTSVGTIENVSVSGYVQGENNTAGILASANSAYLDNQNAFIGDIVGVYEVGGIVGRAGSDTVVSTSYVQGTIEASVGDVGGIVGDSGLQSDFTDVYVGVTISSEGTAGALVGSYNSDGGPDNFENAYWDKEIGPDEAAGAYDADGDTPLNTTEMQGFDAQTNMGGLDFENTWQIVPEDYPVFQWETEGVEAVEITGTVTDALDDEELEGASVASAIDTATTNATGQYTLNVSEEGTTVTGTADVDEGFTIRATEDLDNPTEGAVLDLELGPEYDGNGSEVAPYQVEDIEGLQQIRYNLSAQYEVVDDIEANATETWFGGSGFEPLGDDTEQFTGTFDGNGHLIENLTINRTESIHVGLFGYAMDARLSNVRLQDIYVTGKGSPDAHAGGTSAGLGGLAGLVNMSSSSAEMRIENVSVEGDIEISEIGDRYNTGGIVGFATSTEVGTGPTLDNQNVFRGNVTGDNQVGGILGRSGAETDLGVGYVQGEITGSDAVGGLVGHSSGQQSTFKDMYAAANVTGDTMVGGIVGNVANESDDFPDTYWDTDIGPADAAGGGVGDAAQSVGLVTDDMQGFTVETTMDGLDFENTWQAVPGDYPVFQWELDVADEVEITGTVTDALDGEPIENAFVESSINTTTTGPDGSYALNVSVRGDGVSAVANGTYGEVDNDFTITAERSISEPEEGDVVDLALEPDYAGAGDEADPFQIGDLEDLQQMRYNLTADYELVSDIDAIATDGWFEDDGFEPVGDAVDPFIGTFNGSNYTVSDLTIDRAGESEVGLFGETGVDVRLELVGLEDANITGSNTVGALVGHSEGQVNESYATGDVTGDTAVGGLVGTNAGATTDSYATATVTGDEAGGLVGTNAMGATVVDSYATGAVEDESGTSNSLGGLVGTNDGDLVDVYWNVQTTGQDDAAGAGSTDGSTGLDTARMLGDAALTNMDTLDFETTWNVTTGSQVSYPFLEHTTQDPEPGIQGALFAGGNGTADDPFQIATWTHLDNVRDGLGANYTLVANLTATLGDYDSNFAPIGDTESPFTGTFDGNRSEHVIEQLTIDTEASDVGLFGATGENALLVDISLEDVDVTGNETVGSLVGHSAGIVTNTSAVGTVAGNETVGGLLGVNAGEMNESFASSTVTATVPEETSATFGGLVGNNTGHVNESYATGDVTGNESVGGLAGTSEGSITDSYAVGNVTGDSDVGGFIGSNEGDVDSAYATGNVTGDAEVGGFIGSHVGDVTATYWDETATSQDAGIGDGSGTGDAIGLETADMLGSLATENMDGFNFSVTWSVVDDEDNVSYPYLQNNTQEPEPGLQEALFAGGNGTAENPFQIANWHHLDNVRNARSSYFLVTADLNRSTDGHNELINETAGGFDPIGTDGLQFNGTFDGNRSEHTISNLTIDRGTETDVGLFGVTSENAAIEAVDLRETDITGDSAVGALVGNNSGTVIDSAVAGEIKGDTIVGGLVGVNDGEVNESSASVQLTGDSVVGGLVGANSVSIFNSTVGDSTISGAEQIGGLAGANDGTVDNASVDDITADGTVAIGGLVGVNNASVTNASADTVAVSGDDDIGGLVGNNTGDGLVHNSSAVGTVTGDNAGDLGGLVGTSQGDVVESFANSTVTADESDNLGGLVGHNQGSVTDSYALGDVSGDGEMYRGGLIGYNLGDLNNSYAAGSVTGDDGALGGVVGRNEGILDEVYAVGTVNDTVDVAAFRAEGGIIGLQEDTGFINKTYWDETRTEQSDGIGHSTLNAPEIETGKALATSEMIGAQSEGNLVGFDFGDTWTVQEETEVLNASYPFLQRNPQDPVPTLEEPLFAGGNGTADNPYLIEDWYHLNNVRGLPDANFTLVGDLNETTDRYDQHVNGSLDGFDPIGDVDTPFTGTFDGNSTEHSISDLVINRSAEDDVGLFGAIGESGAVTNVTLEAVNVTGGERVGALAGDTDGTITNSSVAGTVAGDIDVGGLVGHTSADVTDSGGAADVTGNESVGGLVGHSSRNVINSSATGAVTGNESGGLVGYSDGTVDDSSAAGAVTGADVVGGLVGHSDGTVTKSAATGEVSGNKSVGGLVGSSTGTVIESSATGAVAGNASVGGLLGTSTADVELSNATGAVTGGDAVGGLVGTADSGTISESYATGDVAGNESVGGFLGTNAATVDNSYAVGNVTGDDVVGGLVGHNQATAAVSTSYAAGTVTGENSGGLVGANDDETGGLTDAYWNVDSTGQTNATGQGEVAQSVVGLNNPEMVGEAATENMDGFDFDVTWSVTDGELVSYPYLNNNIQEPAPGIQEPPFANGDGTAESPYEISTWAHLDNVRDVLGAEFILLNDLHQGSANYTEIVEMPEDGFEPLGEDGEPFTGNFTGNDYTISDLEIDRGDEGGVGLFGVIEGAHLEDIDLQSVDITGNESVGGLVGYSDGIIINSSVTGTLDGVTAVGGLVGTNEREVNRSSASVDIDTADGSSIGGLVGVNNATVINSSVSDVTATGDSAVGGLVGANNGTVLDSSIAVVDVTGDSAVGGLVGANDDTVFNSSADDVTLETSAQAGGLVGTNDGEITESSAVNVTTATGAGETVGGLVGANNETVSASSAENVSFTDYDEAGGLLGSNDGTVTDSTVTNVTLEDGSTVGGFLGLNEGTVRSTAVDDVTVAGDTEIGGFVGHNNGTISDSHAATQQVDLTPVEVTGNDAVGGFVGANEGQIAESSATGDVEGVTGAGGGFVGSNAGNVTVSYATGNVTGFDESDIGGFAGTSTGNITKSYALGNVISNDGNTAGGIVGHNEGLVLETYAVGGIADDAGSSGGLIGEQVAGAWIDASYWNEDDSDFPPGGGRDDTIGDEAGNTVGDDVEGLSTVEMIGEESKDKMVGFDFTNTWDVADAELLNDESYPFLRNNEQIPAPPIDQLPFAGGNGSAADPYQIESWFHLNSMKGVPDYGYHFELISDLEQGTDEYENQVAGDGFGSIGDVDEPFNGTFDGDSANYTIADLLIDNATADNVGLFGAIDADGHVENLTLENVTVTGNDSVGALAGVSDGTVSGVTVNGTITGNESGTLVGANAGTITDSSGAGDVSGTHTVGGFVGNNTGELLRVNATVTVTGDERVGGLLGASDGTVEESYAAGDVIGGNWTGGLIGNNTAEVTQSYAATTVTGDEGVGGLFGAHVEEGQVTESYSVSNVTGDTLVGGLAGYEDGLLVGTTYFDFHRASPIAWDFGNDQESSDWGLSTAEMIGDAAPENMDGFAFNTTWLTEDEDGDDSYPLLQNNTQVPGPSIEDLFADGDGDVDPYLIDDWFHLDNVRAEPGASFELNATLTAETDGYDLISENSDGFRPIDGDDGFTGTFNGSGHVIADLIINRSSEDRVGLFSVLGAGADIEGIALADANVTGGTQVGALAGDSDGTIAESYVTGNVSGDSVVGGLVGDNAGTLTTSYVTGTVNGDSEVGGLVGDNAGTLTTSYVTGTVNGDFDVGGLVGVNTGEVNDTYWDIETSNQTGGVGLNFNEDGVDNIEGLLTPQLLGPLAEETVDLDFEDTWDVINESSDAGYNVSYPVLQDNRQVPEPGTQTLYAGGFGTDTDPYHVEDWFHLYNVRAASGGEFVLTGDLNGNTTGYDERVTQPAIGDSFDPIGTEYNGFSGTFDGDGHIIANLTIDRPTEDGVALFGGTTGDAHVQAVELQDIDVTGNQSVGSLAGDAETLTVTDVSVTGSVTGNDSVGGLVGYAGELTATNTSMAGDVTGDSRVGGLVGTSEGGKIQESHTGARVTGNTAVGGMVGESASFLTDSYATGNVTADLGEAGGLVGTNSDEVTTSYATGAIEGVESGGLVGINTGDGTVTGSYAAGEVTGDTTGGLVGDNAGTIDDSYWDTRTTGQDDAVGDGNAIVDGAGLTTPQMLGAGADHNMDLDFDAVWAVTEDTSVDGYLAGYPVLQDNQQDPEPGTQVLYEGGDGDGPYQIGNWTHLDNVRANLDAHFELSGDLTEGLGDYSEIVGTSEGFLPIAERHPEFTGTFDGSGHIIVNLTIDRPSADEVGLFSATGAGATLDSVVLEDADVTGNESVGGLVGHSADTVIDASVAGSITGTESVGGLVGASDGTVEHSEASSDVEGTTSVGGLVGASHGTVENAVATGEVEGSASVGGLVGTATGSVKASSATGIVSGTESVGGLVGTSEGPVTASTAAGGVTAIGGESVGGLVGNASNGVTRSNATGTINANTSMAVGGLVGTSDGLITESYATGTVTGDDLVGGLVGESFDDVTNSYATGDVDGTTAGGLVGQTHDRVADSYATGFVTGDMTGGLVGAHEGTIENTYWDVLVTGQKDAIGSGSGTVDAVSGLDTPQMLGAGAKDNMDLNFQTIWNVSENTEVDGNPAGYPVLRDNLQDPAPGNQTLYAAGQGTVDDPWEIDDWFHLNNVRSNLAGTFELTGELDSTVEGYTETVAEREGGFLPIAAGSPDFTGTFDGNSSEHAIVNLTIDSEESDVGLFSTTGEDAHLESVTLEAVTISGDLMVGGLVGSNDGTVTGASVTGTVNGTESVGGLVGSNTGSVDDSVADSEVGGETAVGGLVGTNTETVTSSDATGLVNASTPGTNVGGLVGSNSGTVIDSTASGTSEVTGESSVGGLVGTNDGTVEGGSATRPVSGESSVGGLVGTSDGTVTDSMASGMGEVTGESSVGGLVGTNDGTVEDGSATRPVSGDSGVGGLVGTNDGMVSQSNATGEVTGSDDIGGLVGHLTDGGTVDISDATADVSGDTGVGGLVGTSSGDVSTSNVTGDVVGTTSVGGLVGYNTGDGSVTDSTTNVSVTGNLSVGGLVGTSDADSIQREIDGSNATATVVGVGDGENVGSLVGHLTAGSVVDSTAEGDVTARENVGGLVGYLEAGELTSGTAESTVAGDSAVGGLVGQFAAGTLADSTATGAVNASVNVGGLVGLLDGDGSIDASNATGTVTGTEAGASTDGLSTDISPGSVSDISTADTENNVGGLVGHLSGGSVDDSAASGDVSAADSTNVGGLVGLLEDADVTGGTADGVVTGDTNVGGLAGAVEAGGSIASSNATGDVYGSQDVGGLIGYHDSHDSMTDTLASGNVSGDERVGGLVGSQRNAAGVVEQSNATGDVDGTSTVGGLVGLFVDGLVDTSSAHGAVTGSDDVGGLVGHLDDGTIERSTATGPTTGDARVGGLVGSLTDGSVADSTAESDVEAVEDAGGLVGYASASSITDSMADGAVNASVNVGGLVGTLDGGTVTSSATATVSGDSAVGGLVGNFAAGSINGSSAESTVSVDDGTHVGGLVGLLDSGDTVTDVSAGGTITVEHTSNVGGLVGTLAEGTIEDSVSAANVTASGQSGNVSGFVGLLDSGDTLTGVETSGDVTAGNAVNVGGLVGYLANGNVTSSTADVAIESATGTNVGGLVGFFDTAETLTNVEAMGDITATGATNVGGLVGTLETGTVETSSAAGSVEGMENVGGLVGTLDTDQRVTDVTVTANGNVTVAGETSVGGLVGHLVAGTVENSSTTDVAVEAERHGGGLVGYLDNGQTVRNVTATGDGTVVGENSVGGLVGTVQDGSVWESSAAVEVIGDGDAENVGGLVGYLNIGTVAHSHAAGDVDASDSVGGLIGHNRGGLVTETVAMGAVDGESGVGGLVGTNEGTVTLSNATGTVGMGTGAPERVGGLVGHNSGEIVESYVEGTVDAGSTSQHVGGLVGSSDGTIEDAYVTGDVDAGTNVGGLVGHLEIGGTVNNTYTLSTVAGSTNNTVGGLVGTSDGTIVDSYWNETANDVGVGTGGETGVTGLATEHMQDASPAVHMAFDYETTWNLSSTDYPVLAWQGEGTDRLTSSEPVILDREGEYEFHTAFDAGATVLEVISHNVVVDGTGHTVTDANGGANAIRIYDNATDVTVRNLDLQGWRGSEVYVGSESYATVEQLTLRSSGDRITLGFEGRSVEVGMLEGFIPEDIPTNRAQIRKFVDVTPQGTGTLDSLTLHYEADDLQVDNDQIAEDASGDHQVTLMDEELSMWEHNGTEWAERPRSAFAADDTVTVDPEQRTVTAESVTLEQDTTLGVIANGYFELNVHTTIPDEVFAADDITALVTVENLGWARGNQTVSLNTTGFDSEGQQDSERLTIDGKESEQIELSWVPTLDDINSTGRVSIESDDDLETYVVDVLDPEGFIVEIVDARITEGRTIQIDVVVTNTNPEDADTQNIVVEITGLAEEYTLSQSVSLEPGEQAELTFEQSLEIVDGGEVNIRVASDDTDINAPLTVPPGPGEFDLDLTAVPPEQVQVGEEVSVTGIVENIGGQEEVQFVTIEIGGADSTTQYTLEPGETATLSESWIPSESDVGTHSASISSGDQSASTTFEVVELPPEIPEFQVDIVDVPTNVTAGNVVNLVAIVENVGNGTDTQIIRVDFEGIDPITEEVTLGPGENETLTFEWIVGEDLEEGDYEVIVETEDDRAGASIDVVQIDVETDDSDDQSTIDQTTTIVSVTLLVLTVGGLTAYYYLRRRRLTRQDEDFYRE